MKQILIVPGTFLLLVAAFCYICYPRIGGGTQARETAAMTQVDNFKTVLGAFHVDCGRYPTSDEGLQALVSRPTGIAVTNWHGPYLQKIPRDPWGNSYLYQNPGPHNHATFDLYFVDPETHTQVGNWDSNSP